MGELVALFESECRKLLATEGRATVDLGGVSYLDRQAVRALRTLGRESVVLVNCSPLFEELLTENAP